MHKPISRARFAWAIANARARAVRVAQESRRAAVPTERRNLMTVERRAVIERFIAGYVVDGIEPAWTVRCDTRLDDGPGVREAIKQASRWPARLRHGPERLLELAAWAEEWLDLEQAGPMDREGFVLIHREDGIDRRAPGTHVVLQRELDGWRLARVDRLMIPASAPEFRALVSPAELENGSTSASRVRVVGAWWDRYFPAQLEAMLVSIRSYDIGCDVSSVTFDRLCRRLASRGHLERIMRPLNYTWSGSGQFVSPELRGMW